MGKISVLSGLAALALFGSACAPVKVVETTVVKETRIVERSVEATPQPAAGAQVLRWALEGINEPSTLDPARISDAQVAFAAGLIFRGLVQLDAQLRIKPDGAVNWTISEDSKTYTFKLRPGLRFSDGSEVTAEDVVFSISRSLDPRTGGGNGAYYLSNILGAQEFIDGKAASLAGVVALDPETVQIRLARPSAYFLYQLNFITGYILSKKNVTEGGDAWYRTPVGTGPFVLREWVPNQRLVLTPNPYYWAGPPSQFKQVALVFYGGEQGSVTAFNDYQTGLVDVIGAFGQTPIPSQFVPQVRDLPDFRSAPQFVVRYIGFNNMRAPFNNVKARQALARAIDKTQLIRLLGEASVRLQDRILPGGIPGSELPVRGLGFDPDLARQLWAEAGVDPAQKISLAYAVEGDNEKVAQFIVQQWKTALGINVALEPLELQTFSQRLTDTYNDPASGLHMYYSVWGADYPDPQNWLSQQLRSGVGNNNGHYSNAEFDRLVDQADVEVSDAARRLNLYNRAEQIAVQEAGWLPLFSPNANAMVKTYVTGLVFTGQGVIIPDWSAVRSIER